MTRVFLQLGVTVCLIALYSISVTSERDFSESKTTEIVAMQFLLPEYIPGCKSTPNVQSEDDAARLRRLDAAVETLRLSYESKDMSSLATIFTPLDGSEKLLSAIQKDVERYDTISLTFSIDRILIAEHDYAVHLHWEGVWQTATQDLPFRERGLSVFKFAGTQQITLQTIDGDNPFGIERQISSGDRT